MRRLTGRRGGVFAAVGTHHDLILQENVAVEVLVQEAERMVGDVASLGMVMSTEEREDGEQNPSSEEGMGCRDAAAITIQSGTHSEADDDDGGL